MPTYDYSPFDITYKQFDTLVVRSARLAIRKSREFMPEAPDRDYVDKSLLECWEAQVFYGVDTAQVIEAIQEAYRIGVPIAELVSSTMELIERLSAHRQGNRDSSFSRTVNGPRDVYKYILYLFAYKRVIYMRKNSHQIEVRTIETLPAAQGSMFAAYLPPPPPDVEARGKGAHNPIILRLEWLGTQKALAALLVILKKLGWIRDFKPFSIIQQAFTNADTIDQLLRPGNEDGEPQYPRISKRDFGYFNSIGANRKTETFK
ncbi:hypothetical protein [uncultured Hymenobacter sp.]|uniref:hypothetical protein n=1 Tax=uncultured Hymenobacter sp. TaxID=170016 RepID=UPI0035CABB06